MWTRWIDKTLIGLFLAGLAVPGVLSVMRPADVDSLARENRRPTPLPPVEGNARALSKLPGRLEAVFNDRLAWRERLLSWHAAAKVRLLGVSSAERVILGRKGWLFLDETKIEGRGRRTDDEQTALWLAALRQRRDWCTRRGIDYVLAIAPEKHAIYPEYLPAAQRRRQTPTPAERLLEAMHSAGGVQCVDLHSALRIAKAERQVYFQSDTHWNYEGGQVAYRALVAALGATPRAEADFATSTILHEGDLGRMLHVPRLPLEPCTWYALKLPQAGAPQPIEVGLKPGLLHTGASRPELRTRPGGARRRAVLFHDSFAAIVVIPALAEHFECLVTVPTDSFDPGVIERYHPDVVIQQIVERRINSSMPLHSPEFK